MRLTSVASGIALLSIQAAAHPGHDLSEEIAERRAFLGNIERASLAHCAAKLRARGVEQRNIERRAALLKDAREKLALKKKRDVDTVLATSHNKTELGYTINTDADTLFSGQNSCVLTPEVTQGPYYVGGEYVRRNIIEEQEGVNIVLDYQVIDVDTCEPVPNVYLEMWHCNSTGVYSGVIANGNGDSSDESNIDNTWLRGIQETDSDGVAQFESLFPGHYTGRATHIHLMAHTNATLLANQTLGNDVYASHVGQAFFDQDLIDAVDKISPYSENTQDMTLNTEDSILSEEADTEGVDPLMEYTLLGDSAEDGLFAWLAFGINTTESSKVTPAVFLYEEGGVANSASGGGGGSGGPPDGSPPSGGPGGNGTAPDDLTSGVASDASATATSSSTALASETPSGASSTRRAKCKRSRPTSRA
ncbi:hypothetical protein D7B24_006501 [Verticillium nonalfalfae]|uniref:Intradiol ring-cleavage dioxygenases domain-containing protein n=1 Tax=Verticillium nonalfalfae TaxID=1051616 RepID=A0A3M9YBR0_9PEZI|nr:uncharacterized protein D7B24_006501 [Verticillium nonalfalfae]RNJ56978.1 hypothetical protein D7B24_006501 [Verticillium nonalfalfae]